MIILYRKGDNMGYINNQTGYRHNILENRSVIKKDMFAIIEPDGLVKNNIYGYENCDISILSSPKLGASFVDYIITVKKDGKNMEGIGNQGEEVFLFVISGQLEVYNSDERMQLISGGYFFSPEGNKLYFENKSINEAKLLLYKRKYVKLKDFSPKTVYGNINDIPYRSFEEMENVFIKDLLPSDFAYDFNFHILCFKSGASHGYLETHIQEHGAYILSGKGMYNLDNDWYMVKKGDYIFMASYCLQGGYGVGQEDFIYIYSKDCNRDVEI